MAASGGRQSDHETRPLAATMRWTWLLCNGHNIVQAAQTVRASDVEYHIAKRSKSKTCTSGSGWGGGSETSGPLCMSPKKALKYQSYSCSLHSTCSSWLKLLQLFLLPLLLRRRLLITATCAAHPCATTTARGGRRMICTANSSYVGAGTTAASPKAWGS